ncbi:hypothetical protein A7U60_g7719 [Sanghuangporus baumii]|uniref:Uncharacterized protein n=1 Tax=Sanghuangporus baumii TaxID=108892 RepID=A0A9Q5HSK8_SANBA|nr:hypothetical protein A7U60_g7719 [Sanghuangporus baumii]
MSSTSTSLTSGTGAPSTSSSDTLELATSTATDGITSSFFTDSLSSPTQTDSSNDDNNQGSFATTSSLYLFTFLATLLLLLAISCAIVIRSLVIRRRFQRRVQEALAEGYVFPPNAGPGATPGLGGFGAAARRRFDVGEKPKMWDAHIAPPPPPDEPKEMKWENLMPVSVRVQSDKLTGAGQQPAPPAARPTFLETASFGLVTGHNINWHRPRFLNSRTARPPQSNTGPSSDTSAHGNADASQEPSTHSQAPNPNPDEQPHTANTDTAVEDARLQVSIMIAMPSRYRPRVWRGDRSHGRQQRQHDLARRGFGAAAEEGEDEEDEELPDIVLGTAEMPWKVSVPISRSDSDSNPNSSSNNPSQQQQQQGTTAAGGRRHTETTSSSNR